MVKFFGLIGRVLDEVAEKVLEAAHELLDTKKEEEG